MTPVERTPEHSDGLGNSSGAFVLNSLDPAERARFERLLSSSEDVRAEVTELADTAVELGLAVPAEEPSAALRSRILDQIATTAQLPPLAAAEPEPDTEPEVERGAEVLAPTARAAQRWFQRPAVMLAAAAAALALVFGGGIVTELATGDTDAHRIAEITAAADYERASVPLDGGGSATLVWSGELGRSALIATGMSEAPDGHVYELWYLRDGQAIPAGLFDMDGELVSVVLDGVMHSGDAVGVTIEPEGGSTAPTTDPILVFGA